MEKETLTVKRTDWMKYGLTYDIVKKEYDKIFRYVSRGDIESPAGLIK
jgi:agmatine/peptidylarginine deiminase